MTHHADIASTQYSITTSTQIHTLSKIRHISDNRPTSNHKPNYQPTSIEKASLVQSLQEKSQKSPLPHFSLRSTQPTHPSHIVFWGGTLPFPMKIKFIKTMSILYPRKFHFQCIAFAFLSWVVRVVSSGARSCTSTMHDVGRPALKFLRESILHNPIALLKITFDLVCILSEIRNSYSIWWEGWWEEKGVGSLKVLMEGS